MVTSDGVAKIVDFGLVKLVGSTAVTRLGTRLGTVPYMSPEQARGEAVDHRTDIWSLGVVLYEMLTGVRPFPAEYENALVYCILNAEPKPLTAHRSEIPAALEQIVAKCLAKNPDERYQQVDEYGRPHSCVKQVSSAAYQRLYLVRRYKCELVGPSPIQGIPVARCHRRLLPPDHSGDTGEEDSS
jgi:serine/threonine protein kinase